MAFGDPWWIFHRGTLKPLGQMQNEGSSGYEVYNSEMSGKYLRKKPNSENLLFFKRTLCVINFLG